MTPSCGCRCSACWWTPTEPTPSSLTTRGVTIASEDFDATYAEQEGDEIGPYTLRQQIGEGGFGTVWMAEQTGAISRMVALKVVKAGMDTKQVLSRFEAERQALAMMDHPNIAKILDAGATPAGRPYFVMELVKGVPITQFCREQKLDTQQRLALFQDVCSAINHAHQKGVIHRDIKPSNVMVTLEGDRPVVKVIDFGIAKATQNKLTDKTLFTRFEQFLGTPVHMSPEQAAMSNLDIDTRSDIYSLGVLLYELLAGAPPFDSKSLLSAGYDEMRRIIAEEEPPKPSTRLTETQATESKQGSKAPRISASSLKGDLDWIVMKANDILGSIFESLDPLEIAESGRPLQDILADNLDHAIEELEKGAIGDSLVVASMQGRLGISLLGLGEPKKAVRVFERAYASLEKALGENHLDTLTGMKHLAWGYLQTGQLEKSLPPQEKVFELSKATLGEDHPNTLLFMGSLAGSY